MASRFRSGCTRGGVIGIDVAALARSRLGIRSLAGIEASRDLRAIALFADDLDRIPLRGLPRLERQRFEE